MNYLKAIRGTILPNMLNLRFKAIVDEIRAIKADIVEIRKHLNGGEQPEQEEVAKVVAETISDAPIVEEQPVTIDAAPEFNYLECDDLDQLKAFADEKGVDYDARATVSSLQKKITTKLGVAE